MRAAKAGPRAGFLFLSLADPARISLGLVALLAALPFLFPEHRPPLPSFYDEWLGAALATAAIAVFLTARHAGRDGVPDLALGLVAFAAWLALQAALRAPAYPQLPLAGIAYVLLAAQLAWLGRALAERFGAQRVVDVLAVAIAAAAMANAAIGLAQAHGVPRALAGFIATTSGPRVVGHVGQANLFADYLALGQAAWLYLAARRDWQGGPHGGLRRAGWWAAAMLLVLASAHTQSRGAILFSLWIFALAFSLRRSGPGWPRLARDAGILVLATLVAMALVRESGLARLASGLASEPRLDLWPLAWRLFAGSPWLGVGWGEFAGAAFDAGLPAALARDAPVWTWAHNLVLQLLAEAGAIGAALVLFAALRWWHGAWTGLRAAPTLPLWWVAAVIGTLTLHSLVEQPLWYAHVLALAALIAGIASRRAVSVPAMALRGGLVAITVFLAALLAWTFYDYQRFERGYVIASGRTLAAEAEVSAALEDLRVAARGPLGAQVAPQLYRALPLGAEDVPALQAMGASAMRRWPHPEVVARHAAARALLERSPSETVKK
jgi:O-antigen ligase